MAAGDPLLKHELKALQDDVSAAQRHRRSRHERHPVANADVPAPKAISPDRDAEADDSADAQKLRNQLGELMDEATEFFQEAEKNIAMHPAASVVSALLVGILIGRLLGRR